MALGSALPDNFASQFAGRTLSGGLTGGLVAEMYGGDFGEGFLYGAGTAAAGYLFNDLMGPFKRDVLGPIKRAFWKKVMIPIRDTTLAIAPYYPDTAGFFLGCSTLAITGNPVAALLVDYGVSSALDYVMFNELPGLPTHKWYFRVANDWIKPREVGD